MSVDQSWPRLLRRAFEIVAEDAELWRTARLLVDRYGDRASAEAIERADNMLVIGDEHGEAVWLRICHHVRELQRRVPSGSVH